MSQVMKMAWRMSCFSRSGLPVGLQRERRRAVPSGMVMPVVVLEVK